MTNRWLWGHVGCIPREQVNSQIKREAQLDKQGENMETGLLDQLNPFMALISGRNQLADAIFYDVSSLTAAEWLSVGPWVDRKGGIIVVSPLKRQQPIRHYEQPLAFIIKEGNAVEAIVVAGVGSSVVGTAALTARNVADAYDIDVAGIVVRLRYGGRRRRGTRRLVLLRGDRPTSVRTPKWHYQFEQVLVEQLCSRRQCNGPH